MNFKQQRATIANSFRFFKKMKDNLFFFVLMIEEKIDVFLLDIQIHNCVQKERK